MVFKFIHHVFEIQLLVFEVPEAEERHIFPLFLLEFVSVSGIFEIFNRSKSHISRLYVLVFRENLKRYVLRLLRVEIIEDSVIVSALRSAKLFKFKVGVFGVLAIYRNRIRRLIYALPVILGQI